MPERTVTDGVRHLLKLACVTVPAQVEYIMDGLVPIFQQARDEASVDQDKAEDPRPPIMPPNAGHVLCGACDGRGRQPGATHVCLRCRGSGEMLLPQDCLATALQC